MRHSPPIRLLLALLKIILYTVVVILSIVGLAIGTLETGWAKNRIRQLIVSQANHYLTATLEIGQLQGSLLRGIQLGDIRLSRGGETLVSVDAVSLSYSLKELFEPGLIIRRIRLVRPRVIAAKLPDGRWNLGALIKRDTRRQERSGPGRPLHILAIEVEDGDVTFRDPLSFGAVHVPTRFDKLNVSCSFDYEPVNWIVKFANASWTGSASGLTVERLTGDLADGATGWTFGNLAVQTPRGAFTLNGQVERDVKPTVLDLNVDAARFVFQEWSNIIPGLRNIAVDSSFKTRLYGPVTALATDLDLRNTGGAIHGAFVLNTTVPGWHGRGSVAVDHVNLARWLNRADRPSDISGGLDFDLDLDLGHHFPRGTYTFAGPHAAFLNYSADSVHTRGHITASEVLIDEATATAYGSSVRIAAGSIGVDAPYRFRFQGSDAALDLRTLPSSVPVPHVESVLALDYDATGQFASPYLKGSARFGNSTFLGATIGDGAVGAIDTSTVPVSYSGEGDVRMLDMHRFGVGLNAEWMRDPRWAGTVAGHFRAIGAGADSKTMTLDGGGRLAEADMFDGRLSGADVTLHIANGSLDGTYDGRLSTINPAIGFADPIYTASLTGTANARFTVRGLLLRPVALADYTVDGRMDVEQSIVRSTPLDTGSIVGRLNGVTLNVASLQIAGAAVEGQGHGRVEFSGEGVSDFDYEIQHADLSLMKTMIGTDASGSVATTGHVTGPTSALHFTGNAAVSDLDAQGVKALTTTGQYDVTMPWGDPSRTTAEVDGRASFVEIAGRQIPEATGRATYAGDRLSIDLRFSHQASADAAPALESLAIEAINGSMTLHPSERSLDVSALAVTLGKSVWQLSAGSSPPTISWDANGVATTPLALADARDASQQVAVSGTWRKNGSGVLQVKASHVFLDTLLAADKGPAPYGGVIDADATVRGTRAKPIVTGQVTITDGRVRRLNYQKLASRIDYADGLFHVDARLDQASGVWLTTNGTLPLGAIDKSQPDGPINLAVTSSGVSLGLLEGLTDSVRDVTGQLQLAVTATGTGRDPHVAGSIQLTNTGFLVTSSGARYKNGQATLDLAADRITVSAFHLEDRNGHLLTLSGSLGARELSVADIQITASARHFEILHNDVGNADIDAALNIRGQADRPVVVGDITILSGDIKVDEILARTLYQPYSTQPAATPTVAVAPADVISALNPWQRLALDITVHSRGALRMIGDNVQVAQGTPLGLGSFNLRATGDLYLSKEREQPLYVTGSFDSITGSYVFQGRRFNIDPASSINFRGDLNPELYVTVNRIISGVDARVTIAGSLDAPELRLASTPPLDSSDILSLIVFNSSTNELSASQQQELAVRAGTLAYGFMATPLLSALQRSIGLDTLEIAPPDIVGTGPKVTVGNELIPGLVAQFTRQFGLEPYDEAVVEYYISRILRVRATFSDAQSLLERSPFLRIERAGIDLLLFFSF